MSLISVRTKQGRRAYAGPGTQNEIPNDRFVPVRSTPHINRLINVYGDLEVKPAETPKASLETAPLETPKALRETAPLETPKAQLTREQRRPRAEPKQTTPND